MIAAIRGILQQDLMNGSDRLGQFESVYERLKSSTETTRQTRTLFLFLFLHSRWMLYLLMTLYYQSKSISLSSFTIPKVRLQSNPDVVFAVSSHVDSGQGIPFPEARSSSVSNSSLPPRPHCLFSQEVDRGAPLDSRADRDLPGNRFAVLQVQVGDARSRDALVKKTPCSTSTRLSRFLCTSTTPCCTSCSWALSTSASAGSGRRGVSRSLMEGTKSEEHGIIRNSVNDNVDKQLYQYYRFVISLEEANNAALSGAAPFSLQSLSDPSPSPP